MPRPIDEGPTIEMRAGAARREPGAGGAGARRRGAGRVAERVAAAGHDVAGAVRRRREEETEVGDEAATPTPRWSSTTASSRTSRSGAAGERASTLVDTDRAAAADAGERARPRPMATAMDTATPSRRPRRRRARRLRCRRLRRRPRTPRASTPSSVGVAAYGDAAVAAGDDAADARAVAACAGRAADAAAGSRAPPATPPSASVAPPMPPAPPAPAAAPPSRRAAAPAAPPARAHAPPAPPTAGRRRQAAAAAAAAQTADAPLRPRRKRRAKQWFEEIFDDDYLRTLPFLTPRQTEREAQFIAESLGIPPGGALLDLACGYGRHAMELAAKSYKVTGLDLSLPLLIRAADAARRVGVNVNFIHGDMREMTFENEFDGAYCMFTSFGYFDDDTNRKVAANLARAIKPGGKLLIDVVNRDYIVHDLPTRVWWQGDGCVVLEEVDFNYFSSRVQVQRSIIFEDGRQVEQEISIRAYSLHEIGKVLHHSGFRVTEVSGGLSLRGKFFGANSRQLIVVAEKKVTP